MSSAEPCSNELCSDELSVSTMVNILNQDMNISDIQINTAAFDVNTTCPNIENETRIKLLNASTPLPRLHQSMTEYRGIISSHNHDHEIISLRREVSSLRWMAYEENKKIAELQSLLLELSRKGFYGAFDIDQKIRETTDLLGKTKLAEINRKINTLQEQNKMIEEELKNVRRSNHSFLETCDELKHMQTNTEYFANNTRDRLISLETTVEAAARETKESIATFSNEQQQQQQQIGKFNNNNNSNNNNNININNINNIKRKTWNYL